MKKILLGILIGIAFITMTACDGDIIKNEKNSTIDKRKETIHEHCTRTGTIDDNSSAEMSYEIYYTNERLNRVESTEKVTSTSSSTLEEYEKAYRQIHSYYEGIKYYETTITKTTNSVTSKMVIDYDHINIQSLIEIEGEEDNIFEEGIPKVAKWKELAKKVGMKCTQVS